MSWTGQACPDGPKLLETALCTMGKSLVPLMHTGGGGAAAPAAAASF
eukprot:SAG22_NODE_14865_length_363_cov_0.530303_1_plen_46_part_10